MKQCNVDDCPNWPALNQVPYDGNVESQIVFVGESPGVDEERGGKPFIGRSGRLLRKALAASGVDIHDVFLANSARCRIDKKTLPVKAVNNILRSCRPKLVIALKSIKPKLIVALGDIATRQLYKSVGGILKNHGQFLWSEEFNCYILSTFHPAFCLRSPSFEPDFVNDLSKIPSFINNDYKPYTQDPEVVILDDTRVICPLQAAAIAIDTETQGLDWVSKDGYLISYSFCCDDKKAYQVFLHEPANIPDADFFNNINQKGYRHTVNFTLGVKRCNNFETNFKFLVDVLENQSIKKYMFNGQFDLCFIFEQCRRLGWPLPNVKNYALDVQAAAHLIDENVYQRASLETVRKSLTTFDNQYSLEFDALVDKSNMILVDQNIMAKYAALDAYTTYMAALGVKDKLKRCGDVDLINYLIKFVMPSVQRGLFTLTWNGSYVDKAEIPESRTVLSRLLLQHHAAALAVLPKEVLSKHEEKGLKLTRLDLIRDALFSEEGFNIKSDELSMSGNQSVGTHARTFLKAKKIPKDAERFIDFYEAWKTVDTLLTRYIKGFEDAVKEDGRIHSTYSFVAVTTGRSCLAKDTPIYVLDPRGEVPVQDILPGDWVWSFDNNLLPYPAQVNWSGITKRSVRTVRVLYQRQGSRDVSEIRCTPEHLFRVRDGSYVEAQQLSYGDRLLSIERGFINKQEKKYRRLWFTGFPTEVREHRRVLYALTGVVHKHVHHINMNTSDNRPSNLVGLSPREHYRLHPASAEKRRKTSETLKRLYREGVISRERPYGADSPSWKHYDKNWCIEQLMLHHGSPHVLCKKLGIDRDTFIKKLRLYGIDFKAMAALFDGEGDLITAERIEQAKKCNKVHDARKILKVSYYKAKQLIASDNNHVVLGVIDDGVYSDVYDLTIDGPPNFIANGVCVHNSSAGPALQNIPKRGPSAPLIRRLIAAKPGYKLLCIDYSQGELRWMAHCSGDANMLKVYNDEHGDLHTSTALTLLGKPLEEVSEAELKIARRNAKCFHPETEVLTERGWVPFTDLKQDDKVAAALPREGKINLAWVKPTFFELRKNHCDTLVRLHNKRIDIMVTPDHRMLVEDIRGKLYVTDPANFCRAKKFFNAGMLSSGDYICDRTTLQLAVAFHIHGEVVHTASGDEIKFRFRKKWQADRLIEILTGHNYKEHINGRIKTITIQGDLTTNIIAALDHDNTLPWKWLGLPLDERLLVLKEATFWGLKMFSKPTEHYYTGSSKKAVDVLQAMAAISNVKAVIKPSKDDTNSDVYKLILFDQCYSSLSTVAHETLPYTEDVAVISVPSSFIVVRGGKSAKNQIPVVIGQSANFGLLYLMSVNGFKRYAYLLYDLELTTKEAEDYVNIFFRTYPGIKKYHHAVINFAHKHGYITSPFGRKRRLPEINSNDSSIVHRCERQAVNHGIQSASSDTAIVALNEMLRKEMFNPEEIIPTMFVHDELVFECREDKLDYYYPMIIQEMEHPPLKDLFGIELKVPLAVEAKIGQNYSDLEDYPAKNG